MDSIFNVNFYLFVFLYFLYALFSMFLWTITSYGWAAMLWIIPLLIYYIVLPFLVFLMIFATACLDKKHIPIKDIPIRVKVKLKLFTATICLQILGLLLNTGDWGDRYGEHLKSPVFIIDSLGKIWLEPMRNGLVLQGIIIKLLYFLLFYIFLIGTLSTWKSASDKVQKRK